jgi:hypothetical protein
MGFMDKAKQAAMQAKESAQHVAQQGQAKVASVQQGRNEGELYRNLGEAYYAAERRGGDQDAVASALTALDQHFAAAAQAAAAPSAASDAPAPAAPLPTDAVAPAPAGPAPTAPPAAAPPSGNFTLDDL